MNININTRAVLAVKLLFFILFLQIMWLGTLFRKVNSVFLSIDLYSRKSVVDNKNRSDIQTALGLSFLV